MIRKFSEAAVAALLSSAAFAGGASAATPITGTLQFNGSGPNYFDPANGYVPAGYGNSSGPTVLIGPWTEFGFRDSANTDTADFTETSLLVRDISAFGASPFKITFTAPANFFQSFKLVSGSPLYTYSLSGNIFTVNFAGTSSGQTYDVQFTGIVVGPNVAKVYQVGDENVATVTQINGSSGNLSKVYQASDYTYTTGLPAKGNHATVHQDGGSTILTDSLVIQQGSSNTSTATLTGDRNISRIAQLGDSNLATVHLTGTTNTSQLMQGLDPNGNFVGGSNGNSANITFYSGVGSVSRLSQTGPDNVAQVEISGDSQFSDVRQSGAGSNVATVHLTGSATGAMATILQNGTSNQATLTAMTAGGMASVTQTGVGNVATSTY